MPQSKSPRKGKSRSRKLRGRPPKPDGPVFVSEEFRGAHARGDKVGMNIAAAFGGVNFSSPARNDNAIRKFQHNR